MITMLVWLFALLAGDCGIFQNRCDVAPPTCVRLSANDWCYPPGGPVLPPARPR